MGAHLHRNYRRDPRVRPFEVPAGCRPRAIIDQDGTLWPSARQAGAAWGLSPNAASYRAEHGLAGWRFAEPVSGLAWGRGRRVTATAKSRGGDRP